MGTEGLESGARQHIQHRRSQSTNIYHTRHINIIFNKYHIQQSTIKYISQSERNKYNTQQTNKYNIQQLSHSTNHK